MRELDRRLGRIRPALGHSEVVRRIFHHVPEHLLHVGGKLHVSVRTARKGAPIGGRRPSRMNIIRTISERQASFGRT